MPESQRRDRTIFRDYYEALLIAVIFVNFAKIFVFQAFKIPTGSMIDNLLVGDHIIVNKFVYGPEPTSVFRSLTGLRPVSRGDVVVFRFPPDPKTDFVKRVVGLPGDVILIRDKQVLIDGKPLKEDYKIHDDSRTYPLRAELPEPYRSRDQFGPFQVPPQSYFVMGDNRDRSNDSRYWGPVPRRLIKGRAFLIYWSFRGNDVAAEGPPAQRIRQLAGVVTHFFSNTRWDRTFMIIDSKYHYRDLPESTP